MSVREDCRHYIQRSTTGGDLLQRCRLGAAEEQPSFACPDECLFFEARVLSTAGWGQEADEPMSNTASGLAGLPMPPGRGSSPNRAGAGKNKKKGRRSR